MQKLKNLLIPVFIIFIAESINIYCLDVYEFSFGSKKYEIVKEKKNWIEAASVAVSRGGYLVQIDSKAENDAIYNAITKGAKISQTYTSVMDGGGVAYLWIGGTDKWEEGKWIWDGNNDGEGENFWNGQGIAGQGNGRPVEGYFVNWGGASSHVYAEPDNFGNNQNAAAMALEPWPKNMGGLGIAGEWNDIALTNTIYFIVEYDVSVEAPILESPPNNATNIERKPTFVWKSVEGGSYQLQVSMSKDFSSDILIDESNLLDTFYTPNSEFDAGLKLYWKVKTIKDGKESVWSAVWNFTTEVILPPEAPTLVAPPNYASGVDTLPLFVWNQVDAVSYHLKVALTDDFSAGIVIDQENIKDTSFLSKTILEQGKTYYWSVRAFKQTYGDWASTWNFKVLIPKPQETTLLLPPNEAEDVDLMPLFKFTLVPNVDIYKFILSKNADLSNPVELNNISAALNIDTLRLEHDLEEDTKYYWSVNTINVTGETRGPIWEFKTKKITLVTENYDSNSLIVFPNPAFDKLNMNLSSVTNAAAIEIYNSIGVLFSQINIVNDELVLDIKNYPVGLYFIVVKDVNGKIITLSLFMKK